MSTDYHCHGFLLDEGETAADLPWWPEFTTYYESKMGAAPDPLNQEDKQLFEFYVEGMLQEFNRETKVAMDHVIDRTQSVSAQLAQAEGWLAQMHRSYIEIQKTCTAKDAKIEELQETLKQLGPIVKLGAAVFNA